MIPLNCALYKKGTNMKPYRSTAVLVGVLFILGTVAASFSVVLTQDIIGNSDYLSKVGLNETSIVVGALLVLIMGMSLAFVPILMFPLLRTYNESLAIGYIVFRSGLETVLYVINVICLLCLIPLSHAFLETSHLNNFYFQILGDLLLKTDFQISPLLKIIFSVGSLLFNYMLYQSKLVPRWLSGWGIVGATLHLISGLVLSFNIVTESFFIKIGWDVIIAIQEMVFALWLILKGFNLTKLDIQEPISKD